MVAGGALEDFNMEFEMNAGNDLVTMEDEQMLAPPSNIASEQNLGGKSSK